MKKCMTLGCLVALCVSLFAPVSQAITPYNIDNGSIMFEKNDTLLWVTQNGTTDSYSYNNGAYTNILIYGDGTPTENTIWVDSSWGVESGRQALITLSNVVIHSTTDIPFHINPDCNVKLYLATGTSNELRTTAVDCPALRVSQPFNYQLATALTITGQGMLVAVGGMYGAGIGCGSYDWVNPGGAFEFDSGAGKITIDGSVKIIAYGGSGAAAIGSGDSFGNTDGWVGGTITISSNAAVYALGGETGAGIGGGNASESATISIGPSTQVIAASDGTRQAIDDADDTLGGDGYVMLINYYAQKAASTVTTIQHYTKVKNIYRWTTLTSAEPSIAYQSIAFSFADTNTFHVQCASINQEHDNLLNFPIVATGLTIFDPVVNGDKVVITFNMNGGEGGTEDVEATVNLSMPAATAPTNSTTRIVFLGYFLADGTTQYYNADMSSARTCNISTNFTLVAKWYDPLLWDGTTRTYDWYNGHSSPFTLDLASDLAGFAAIVNGTDGMTRDTFPGNVVILSETLDLAGFPWTPIGDYAASSANIFNGTFNGGSKTITGLFISTNVYVQGLFGYVSSASAISNLTVDASVTGGNYVGAICGFNSGGTLQDCVVSNAVTGGAWVGGVAGYHYGLLQGCASYATVQGTDYVGGLVGTLSSGGKIRNSIVSGPVIGSDTSSDVGGIVGYNYGIVQNAIFTSTATSLGSYARVGGIAGYNPGQINSCLMRGSLAFDSWNPYVGAIAGEHSSGSSVTNAYFHTSAGVSKGLGYAAGAYTAIGSFPSVAGAVTATDSTALLYGKQLHLALNRGVYPLNGDNMLKWWTTATNAYPTLTTNRPQLTLSTPEAVPYTWMATYYPGQQATFENVAQSFGANGYRVWESYLAALNPTNATSAFRAFITLTNETRNITWSPNAGGRIYTVLGKAALSDGSWGTTNSASRFFKVKVELP